MNRNFWLFIILISVLGCRPEKIYVDIDGQRYPTKRFGSDIWMLENLSVTHDTSRSDITYYFPNNDAANTENFGLLYDYATACKVCPNGWRLPNNSDWDALFQLDKSNNAALYKDVDIWKGEANTNTSSFAARPAGTGNNGEHPNHFLEKTLFWSSDMEDDHFVWTYILELGRDSIRIASQHPTYAFSVRCVKVK